MIHQKTKLVSLLASKLQGTDGHQLRHAIAMHLGCGERIDCFGAVAGKEFLSNKVEAMRQYMFTIAVSDRRPSYIVSRSMSEEVILFALLAFLHACRAASLRLSLESVFQVENSQDDTYFSEKLLDCFMTGTVPIYWGAQVCYCTFFSCTGAPSFLPLLHPVLSLPPPISFLSLPEPLHHSLPAGRSVLF